MAFDVVVVGAGHAGCEAAAAVARLGWRVAVVTLRRDQVGRLSCNPAMGGLAKGNLVREVDALGGLVGEVTDAATIQVRRLNTRKGLAVQATRAQVDIDAYPAFMAARLAAMPGLTLLEGEVAGLRVEGGGERIVGVTLADGAEIVCRAVVLTTGTFLGGLLHCGDERVVGGRIGEGAASRLTASLRALGVTMGRLKTGTTPRLDARTIAWDEVEPQEENAPTARFSFGPPVPRYGAVTCHLAYTTAETHDLIRGALDRSPLYTGQIEGRGPRYCPSIEDKVVRFGERDRHLLFLEPEGLHTDRVYVNGASTSLPRDVQDALVRSVPGLGGARILQYGYAVEYDYADPTQLGHDLGFRGVAGLYFAGQINGTSGYEEAAGQGLVAGVNAARHLAGEAPWCPGRDEAYLGVMVDDLVTRGVGGEPYRMFPSRAEHRLHLREDNADRRLTPAGRAMGLVSEARWARFAAKEEEIGRLRAAVEAARVPMGAALPSAVSRPTPATEVLRRPEIEADHLRAHVAGWEDASDEALEQVEIDVKYAGYLARDERRRAETRRMDHASLAGIDFTTVTALSAEVRERLTRGRPGTLGAAARLPGVTPAALDVLTLLVMRRDAGGAA